MAASIKFDLIGSATSAVEAFKKTTDASKESAKSAETTTSSFAKIAGAIATGYAVTKVVDFGKETVSAAENMQVANKDLALSFANAGDKTGELAKHAIDLAESFGKQAGISPTVIKGAEGILATFQNVSSATAVNAGVFDRATKAAADLAAAGFGNLSDNAKTLGKALNDPVKYMSTLARSGVALTSSQQGQIKAMVKQGDLLGAQKTLLSDVEQRVGGMATATATAGAKTGVAYDEMKEKIGTALLPAVNDAQTAMAGFFDFVIKNSSWLLPLVGAILAIVAAIKIWTIVQELLNSAMLSNPIGIVIIAIVALIAVIVLVVKHWKTIQAAAAAVWGWIVQHWPYLVAVLLGPFAIAAVLIATHLRQIQAIAAVVVQAVGAFFARIVGYIVAPFVAAYTAVAGWLARIESWASSAAGSVGRFFAGVYSAIVSPFERAYTTVAGVFAAMVAVVARLPGQIAGAVAGVFNAVIAPFQRAYQWVTARILGPLRSAWNSFARIINSVAISTPAVSIAGHSIIPAFHWTPPWRIPYLAAGGLMVRSGLVYAHAGEVVAGAPAIARGLAGTTDSGRTTNIHMVVNVPATANPAETGREIASALRSFFSAGGRLAVPAGP